MPLKFWDQAFLTATYLINILPSKVLDNKTPVELLLNDKPHYNSLRVFGCACWPNLRPYNTRKLAFHSTQCVFLGYSSLHKGFKCLEPNTGHIYISRDVVFDGNIFPFSSLHPNAGARLRNEISLLSENLTPFVPGDVVCHVSNATNRAASSNLREVQEQEEVQELQEIMDEEATDPTAASDPSTSPERDSPTPAAAPTKSVYKDPEANLDMPHGGTGSTPGSPSVPTRAATTGSSAASSGSGVATSSEPMSTNETAASDPPVSRPHTRLQSGIVKPKVYTDGTVRYANICTAGEPNSVEEVLKSVKWKNAMQDEYDALQRNGTWSLVPASRGRNLIDCKWVFKIKRRADGRLIGTRRD